MPESLSLKIFYKEKYEKNYTKWVLWLQKVFQVFDKQIFDKQIHEFIKKTNLYHTA